MTEKPNSVCKHCQKLIFADPAWYHPETGSQFCDAMRGREFEKRTDLRMAEPAEPSPDKNELDTNAKKSMMAQQDRADRDLAKKLGVDVDEMRKVGLRGTPKLEEIARKCAEGLTAWRLCEGFQECITTIDLFAAILRPFITPACSPESVCPSAETFVDNFLRGNLWLSAEHESEKRDAIAVLLKNYAKHLLATPASTGEANGLLTETLASISKFCAALVKYDNQVGAEAIQEITSCAIKIKAHLAPTSVPQAELDKCKHDKDFYNCDLCERAAQAEPKGETK